MSKNEKDLFSQTAERENGEVMTEPGMEIISLSDKPLTSEQIKKEVEGIERNIELYNKIKTVAIKLTKPKDWVLQMDKSGEGSPYLMDRGAENIAIAYGVSILPGIKLTQEWNEDEKGRYYAFIAQGRAISRKIARHIEDIGVCSQRDKFFGKIGNEWKPIEDVDMANIRRKAITNLYNRLIKRILGLMNLDVDDLKTAGIDISKVPKVEYKTGSKKAEVQLSEIDLLKREAIWKTCLQLVAGDEKSASDCLKYHSTFKGKDNEGKVKDVFANSIKDLSTPRWINMTLSNVKNAFKKEYPQEPLPFDEEKLK